MPAVLARLWHALWWQLSLDHAPAHQFACCRWLPSIFYLIYRWILFIALLMIGIASFACQRLPPRYEGPKVEINYFKWFIYFTNWGFMTITLQAGLALYIVHRTYTNRTNISECETRIPRRPRTSALHRAYWLAMNVATDLAFVITFIYWLLVHDPKIHDVNALNLLVHGGNSLVMVVELVMTSHPIRMAHALYSVAVGLTYGVFSAVYWALGGTDRFGQPAIYPPLDWNHPWKALGFVTACAIVLLLSHASATLIEMFCTWLAARMRLRRRPASLTLANP